MPRALVGACEVQCLSPFPSCSFASIEPPSEVSCQSTRGWEPKSSVIGIASLLSPVDGIVCKKYCIPSIPPRRLTISSTRATSFIVIANKILGTVICESENLAPNLHIPASRLVLEFYRCTPRTVSNHDIHSPLLGRIRKRNFQTELRHWIALLNAPSERMLEVSF